MAKQYLVLNNFSGGLNTYQDPRDLEINELQVCQNFTFQKSKSLVSIGSFTTHADAASAQAATVVGGYGLTSFESDYSPVPYEAVDNTRNTILHFDSDTDEGITAGSGTLVGTSYEAGAAVVSSDSGTGNEMITDSKNRDFASASDWVEYSPSSTLGGFGDDASPAYLEITGTSSTAAEGAELALDKLDVAPVATRQYRVSAKIWWNSSDPGVGDAFYFNFGGTESSDFEVDVTSKSTTYTETFNATNSTGKLQIYIKANTTAQWNIDDVSVKEIASDTSGIKGTVESNITPGTQIKISGTQKNNGIYTVAGVGDSVNVPDIDDDDTSGTANMIEVDAGFSFSAETIKASLTTYGTVSITTHSLGENLLILSDVNNGNLDAYTKSSDAFNNASISPRKSGIEATSTQTPEYSFYSVDNALRVSDGKAASQSQQVRWYGFISRHHFKGVQHSSTDIIGSATVFSGWFDKDNKLSPPDSARTDTSNTYPGVPNAATGATGGFSIDYDSTNSNDSSQWISETWKIAVSFIYDGNQESLLFIPTSNNTFTTVSGNDLRLRVMAKIGSTEGYDARISGGRIYCKASDSEGDPWLLLANIDLESGVSASMTGDKISWVAASSVTLYSDIVLLRENIDTYESINGYPPDINYNSIGEFGEGWKTGVVTNRRAFVANLKIKSQYDQNIMVHGDRIMYSMPNKFDTFPSFNFIDVVKGDAEAYLKLESFADRLIALKHNSVQIINISSPSDTSWFLEADIKNNGVAHPSAVFRSEQGILWANKKGMFIYNGSSIINLTENKIAQSDWSSFITDHSIVGYDGNSNMALVIRDSENAGGTQGDAYIYDFKTRAWSFATDILPASAGNYTNFITDYNGNLTIGVQSSSNIQLKTLSYNTLSDVPQDTAIIRTKDIDFGVPSLIKKIYAVFITYKSDAAQTAPVKLYFDGASSSGTAYTGNFINTSGQWKVLRVQHSSISTCKSVSIEIQNQTASTGSSSGLQINDITIEYRIIRNDRATSDT